MKKTNKNNTYLVSLSDNKKMIVNDKSVANYLNL
jgi:hypothetical protein